MYCLPIGGALKPQRLHFDSVWGVRAESRDVEVRHERKPAPILELMKRADTVDFGNVTHGRKMLLY